MIYSDNTVSTCDLLQLKTTETFFLIKKLVSVFVSQKYRHTFAKSAHVFILIVVHQVTLPLGIRNLRETDQENKEHSCKKPMSANKSHASAILSKYDRWQCSILRPRNS